MDYKISNKTESIMKKIINFDGIKQSLAFVEEDHEHTIQDQLDLVVIPAPTFHEQKRAEFMTAYFKRLGLTDIHIDGKGNATGVRKGVGNGPKIVIDAHMDTVYPMDTKLEPVRENRVIKCPGIVDDTRGCVAMLSVIRALNDAGIQTEGDLVFLGSVCEEGIGAFGGMRAFIDENRDIDGCICLDGAGASGIIYQSTGFKTHEITFKGVGGHAFMAFGEIANPLHAAARAIAKIADIEVPEMPKTTYSVSNFHAGNDAGIHAIVPEAVIKVNYRSNGQRELEILDQKIMKAIEEACQEETDRWGKNTITYEIKTYCDVKAASLEIHDPMVEAAYESIRFLGNEPWFVEGGPTNASIPISNGIPAVCLGAGGEETYAHNADMECFHVEGTYQMVQLALLMSVAAGGIAGVSEPILEKRLKS